PANRNARPATHPPPGGFEARLSGIRADTEPADVPICRRSIQERSRFSRGDGSQVSARLETPLAPGRYPRVERRTVGSRTRRPRAVSAALTSPTRQRGQSGPDPRSTRWRVGLGRRVGDPPVRRSSAPAEPENGFTKGHPLSRTPLREALVIR